MNKLLLASVIVSIASFAYAQTGVGQCIVCAQTNAAAPQCIDTESNSFTPTSCGVGSNSTCFSRVTSAGFVERGCIANLNLPEADRGNCTTDSEFCTTCDGVGCNIGIFPVSRLRCHICHGGPESNCSGVVTGNPTICPTFAANDNCFIARPEGPEGSFERGCLSSVPGRCGETERCHRCNSNGCNNQNYNAAFSISSGTSFIAILGCAFLMLLN